MELTLDKPLTRRLLTIPSVFILFVLVTILLPALMLGALVIDLIRWARTRSHWMSIRIVGFAWLYLMGEVWALIALMVTTPLPDRITYRLQVSWARWNLGAVRILFGLELSVEGEDVIAPGPIVVLSRHASLIDTLLPPTLVSGGHGIRLRYVLKKELLVDPALDIAGNRLPNHFIDRNRSESAAELAAVRALAGGLGANDGVLIYPEGTRFSHEKREGLTSRYADRGGELASMARSLRLVLPPRPGGTLAILDEANADVVVLAHHGLEGFAKAADVWRGELVGNKVSVRFWRVAREALEGDRAERTAWLYDLWSDIDNWVVGQAARGGGPEP